MEKTYRYSVAPFSQTVAGKEYRGAGEGCDPCGICMRKTRRDRPTHAVVIEGGAAWGDANSPQDSGYMGYWPIGPDCHRKFVIAE